MRSLSLLSNLLRFLSRAEIPDFLLLPLLPFALPLLPFRFGRDCFRDGEGPSLPELSEQSRTQTAVISITALQPQCHGSQPVTSPTNGINLKSHSFTPQLCDTFLAIFFFHIYHPGVFLLTYRVIHDLWTLLQEVIS